MHAALAIVSLLTHTYIYIYLYLYNKNGQGRDTRTYVVIFIFIFLLFFLHNRHRHQPSKSHVQEVNHSKNYCRARGHGYRVRRGAILLFLVFCLFIITRRGIKKRFSMKRSLGGAIIV